MRTPAPPLFLALLIPTILLLTTPIPSAHAQPLNEFVEIYSPDPGMYDMYTMKFTFLGPQLKSVLSLGIAGPAVTFDPVMFEPWQVDYDYSNDEDFGNILIIPGMEWQMFMDIIMGDPMLQDTGRIPNPNCSVMIYTSAMGPPMCWEHVMYQPDTDFVFQLLEDSVADPVHKDIIARFRRQMAGVR